MNKPTKIITHHAVSLKTHTATSVSGWHFDRWGGYAKSRRKEAPYAGYTYIINWDGKTVQCRDHDEEGIHTRGQNFSSIGVCFMGNSDKHYPSEAQKESWRTLYTKIHAEFPHITEQDIYPHRKYANKSCHGKLLSDDYYTLLLGTYKKLSVKQLTIKLLQLQVKLLTMLLNERSKG